MGRYRFHRVHDPYWAKNSSFLVQPIHGCNKPYIFRMLFFVPRHVIELRFVIAGPNEQPAFSGIIFNSCRRTY